MAEISDSTLTVFSNTSTSLHPNSVKFPSDVSATLYVGDLDTHISEAQLLLLFSSIGNVSSVRVCRDLITGRSLGYGYVNYFSRQDATRALEKMNHTPLYGKLIRVMWSNRDPNGRKSGIGNLFVKNLSESIDNVKLHEIFSKYGNILSCKVATFPDGKSKGFGFVQFEFEDSAEKAIENVNGSTIAAKEICIGLFVIKNDQFVPNPEVEYTNLYIKNMDLDMTEELLQEKFSEFGKISKLTILKDSNGKSKGVAFVNFETPDNARRAVEEINGTQVGSMNIYIAKAQKKAAQEQIMRHQFDEICKEHFQHKGSNLYVKNIKCDVHEDELREVFSQCGTITSVRLMRDENGKSRGFGFICFSTAEEAGKAVNILCGSNSVYLANTRQKGRWEEILGHQFDTRCKVGFQPKGALWYRTVQPHLLTKPLDGGNAMIVELIPPHRFRYILHNDWVGYLFLCTRGSLSLMIHSEGQQVLLLNLEFGLSRRLPSLPFIFDTIRGTIAGNLVDIGLVGLRGRDTFVLMNRRRSEEWIIVNLNVFTPEVKRISIEGAVSCEGVVYWISDGQRFEGISEGGEYTHRFLPDFHPERLGCLGLWRKDVYVLQFREGNCYIGRVSLSKPDLQFEVVNVLRHNLFCIPRRQILVLPCEEGSTGTVFWSGAENHHLSSFHSETGQRTNFLECENCSHISTWVLM